MQERNLTVREVSELTGWSTAKVHSLIRAKKIFAFNTSSGDKAFWEIPPESLKTFYNTTETNGASKPKKS